MTTFVVTFVDFSIHVGDDLPFTSVQIRVHPWFKLFLYGFCLFAPFAAFA